MPIAFGLCVRPSLVKKEAVVGFPTCGWDGFRECEIGSNGWKRGTWIERANSCQGRFSPWGRGRVRVFLVKRVVGLVGGDVEGHL
ncbi:hypothetical protein VNO78_21787 [Psophocarpus tetragonolobus]|uniref:Uncharacterized protein n=1 Tax=Psophocarpus tetragonolobus TaxID=3891 RepID=A0AAN9SH07_PSOTE